MYDITYKYLQEYFLNWETIQKFDYSLFVNKIFKICLLPN